MDSDGTVAEAFALVAGTGELGGRADFDVGFGSPVGGAEMAVDVGAAELVGFSSSATSTSALFRSGASSWASLASTSA